MSHTHDSSSDAADPISTLLTKVLGAPLPEQVGILEALCAQHPDCGSNLRQAYQSLQQLDLVNVGYASASGGMEIAPSPPPDALPRQVGPFRLLEFLGAGGMGAVYRAEDTELKRMVALKLIRSELLASDRTRTRFQRESAALARLDHPGLCTAYRAGATDGQPWIAMRLVRGTTLASHMASRRSAADDPAGTTTPGWRSSTHVRREAQRVVGWFEKIARALATAHAVGVVHRDLKPGNIVLTAEDEPVVIDFGLVHLDDSESHLTISGDHIGTPAYMAPEQVQTTDHGVAPTTDVYALGVTMFEALTGRLPYAGKSREELFTCITRGRRLRLRQVTKDLPTDLELVLERALELEPARRYANMSDLAEDLRRFRVHEPLLVAPPSAWYRLRKLVRRYPGPITAGGAVFVTAVVGAVVALQFALREQAKVREFDQLKGSVLYESAIAREQELHPPWPHKVEAMERWLRDDVGKLLAMRGGIEQTVHDLEARAFPPTAEEPEADRRRHPRFAEFELLGMRVASLRYAQAIRAGTPLVVHELTAAQQALGARALHALARERVAPKAAERTVWGEEALGLAMARAAVACAYGSYDKHHYLDTLAWALLANGQDAEAKEKSANALGNAPDREHEAYLGFQQNLETAITKATEILWVAEKDLAELATVVSQRQTFRFELESQRFLHDALADLLAKLESLERTQKADVDQRLSWATQVQELSLHHPNARHTWAAVRAAIASNPKYAGCAIELGDQDITGLVPIGENPVTRLWEFYELRSAWDGNRSPKDIPIPSHDAEGRIAVTAELGIVFVLLPGGTFLMGAQKDDEGRANYDPNAEWDEWPHELTLAPFFLARHELTQGQWARLWSGREDLRWPSWYTVGTDYPGTGKVTPAQPVENVDWDMCELLLRQHGLVLPTEAQWEYGCRGGTTRGTPPPWYTGLSADTLEGHCNVLDRTGNSVPPPWPRGETFDDGFKGPAPVGHYKANAFGLFDVCGNLCEWCRDWYGAYGTERAGDGLRSGEAWCPPAGITHRQSERAGDFLRFGFSHRCFRGGSFFTPAARSADRDRNTASIRSFNVGARAARSLRP